MLQRQTSALWLEVDRFEESDPRRRFKMLRKLIRLGHSDSGLLARVAYAYAEGEGVKCSPLQAQRWNRKAWRRGSASAACNAGIDAQLDGRYALAIIWFRRAIAMGDSDALLHLAKFLRSFPNCHSEVLSLLRRRVYYVAAAASSQMLGIGRAMVEAAEDWLEGRGITKVQLLVREQNSKVAAFYQRLGCEVASRIVMSKWISEVH